MIRLVATDLDGTLLRTDGTLSRRTHDAIAAAEDHGIAVVFVTGRPLRWMGDLWPLVGDHGVAICSNGAITYDVPGRAITRVRPIDAEVGRRVVDQVRAAVPGTHFSVERLDGFAAEHGFPYAAERGDGSWRLAPGTIEEILAGDIVKLLALHPAHPAADYWLRVEAAVAGLVTTTWSSPHALAEMSAAGVTKATTLAELCAARGIAPDEVVAVGDMPNDVDLLRWAGTSYAVANAHPDARAAADLETLSNDEDGVAAVLEGLVSGSR